MSDRDKKRERWGWFKVLPDQLGLTWWCERERSRKERMREWKRDRKREERETEGRNLRNKSADSNDL